MNKYIPLNIVNTKRISSEKKESNTSIRKCVLRKQQYQIGNVAVPDHYKDIFTVPK